MIIFNLICAFPDIETFSALRTTLSWWVLLEKQLEEIGAKLPYSLNVFFLGGSWDVGSYAILTSLFQIWKKKIESKKW